MLKFRPLFPYYDVIIMPFPHIIFNPPQNCRTLYILLDIDGCLCTKISRDIFIENLIDLLQTKRQYKKVIFSVASLRQNINIDYLNAETYREINNDILVSCKVLVDEFYIDFVNKLDIAFVYEEMPITEFEPLLTGDVYYDLEPGTTFTNMSTKKYTSIFNNKLSQTIEVRSWRIETMTLCAWEEGKISYASKRAEFVLCSKIDILYMFFQHMARKLGPHNQFMVLFFDDRMDILNQAAHFLLNNKYLIPQTAYFQGVEFNTNLTGTKTTPIIQGQGRINPEYEIFMRSLPEIISDTRDYSTINKIFTAAEKTLIIHKSIVPSALKKANLFSSLSGLHKVCIDDSMVIPSRLVNLSQVGVYAKEQPGIPYTINRFRLIGDTTKHKEHKHTLYVYGMMEHDPIAELRLAMLYFMDQKESIDILRALQLFKSVLNKSIDFDHVLSANISYLLACIYRDLFDRPRAVYYYEYACIKLSMDDTVHESLANQDQQSSSYYLNKTYIIESQASLFFKTSTIKSIDALDINKYITILNNYALVSVGTIGDRKSVHV